MLNLANCYEFQMRYKMAARWYQFSIEMDKEQH